MSVVGKIALSLEKRQMEDLNSIILISIFALAGIIYALYRREINWLANRFYYSFINKEKRTVKLVIKAVDRPHVPDLGIAKRLSQVKIESIEHTGTINIPERNDGNIIQKFFPSKCPGEYVNSSGSIDVVVFALFVNTHYNLVVREHSIYNLYLCCYDGKSGDKVVEDGPEFERWFDQCNLKGEKVLAANAAAWILKCVKLSNK